MRNPALRAFLAAVVALALVAGVAAGGDASATIPSPGGDATPSANGGAITPAAALDGTLTGADPQTDDSIAADSATRIRIDLNADRSARWTVSVRYSLADGNETAVFETAGDRFVDGEFGPDAAVFEGFRREASRTVDRRMTIEDVEREAVVHEDPSGFDVAADEAVAVGELRLRFTWTAFLAQDGENLVLGDALTTPGNETWLRSLEADQTLELATPDGYAVTGTPGTTAARLADGDVVIEGPQTFENRDGVAVVYGPAGGVPWAMLAAAIVIAALLVAGSVFGYRRLDGGDAAGLAGAIGGRGGAAEGDASGDASRDGATTAGDDRDGDASDAAAAGTADDDEPNLSLLSDGERVERLLGNNGGRMRQADIVAETGWSDAKVSQLLSTMVDEGRVEKLRLGRENLISLPDDGGEPESDGSRGGGTDDETGDGASDDRIGRR